AQSQSVRKSFFKNRTLSGDTLVTFDGIDDSGSVLKDGIYEFVLRAKRVSGDTEITARRRITVKSKSPEIFPKLTTSEVRGATLPLKITNWAPDPSWTASVELLDKNGQSIGVLYQKARYAEFDPTQMVWADINAAARKSITDGEYQIRVAVEDEAANRTVSVLKFNYKTNMTGKTSIQLDRPFMTPNGDGVFDRLIGTLTAAGSESGYLASVRIESESGRKIRDLVAKVRIGNGQSLPLGWNGTDDLSVPVPDGVYAVVTDLTFEDGSVADRIQVPFVLVSQLPTVNTMAPALISLGRPQSITLNMPVIQSPVLNRQILEKRSTKVTAFISDSERVRIVGADGFNADERDSAVIGFSNTVLSGLSDGYYSVSATIEDALGNRKQIDGAGGILIDSTPPVAPVILSEGVAVNTVSVTVTASVPESIIVVKVNGIALSQIPLAATGNQRIS
ncbi:hypothetical protein EBR96_09735, partial [bacterium]|nr:hypothetical protein [bacterium]